MRHHPHVDLSIPIFATVSAQDTGEFDTTVSHLTNTTAFLETMHTGTFGQPLELRVLGLTLHAEVIFVSDAPMGWVIRFPENKELLSLANGARPPEALPADALIMEEPLDMAIDMAIDLPIEAPIEPDLPSDAPLFWGEPTPTFDGPPPRFRAS